SIVIGFVLLIAFIVVSCEEKMSKIDVESINIYLTEDLVADRNPVCLKLNISSEDKFDNIYLFEEVVSIHDNNILIEIDEITNKGKCEYPSHLSAPKPDNYQCSASTDYFTLDNLTRGLYTIEIKVLENTFNGQLNIYDQHATIYFNDNNVGMYDSVMHIVPDSCIFGTYYSMNSDSAGYQDMINQLLNENCRQINVEPGLYRAFEVDSSGKLMLNPGQITTEPTFILKFDLDIDKVIEILNDFVANSNDAYGIIFKDHFGNSYNIKK
ncbi:MAG: hypothetical protein ABFS35_18690, partial [Bacteroidota bacterium]